MLVFSGKNNRDKGPANCPAGFPFPLFGSLSGSIPGAETMQNHYNNEKGSLYKFAEDHGLNSWEFDLVKRIVRCRKKGQFREDLEKSKYLIDLYLLEMDGPTPAPVTTYSYSVIENPSGKFEFTIKYKGEEVHQHFAHYDTHLGATQGALDWIKAQENQNPPPVTTYSYSVIENPSGKFDFTIKDKGEEVYQEFGYNSHLAATKFAQKWIKEQEPEEPEQEEPTPAPVTTYSYSVRQKDSGFYFTIKDKGEEVYKGFVYRTRLKATKAAQELIKAYTNREKEG